MSPDLREADDRDSLLAVLVATGLFVVAPVRQSFGSSGWVYVVAVGAESVPDGVADHAAAGPRDPSLRGVEISFEGHERPGAHLDIGLVSAT